MNLTAINNNVNQQNPTYWLLALFPMMGAFTRHWFSTFLCLLVWWDSMRLSNQCVYRAYHCGTVKLVEATASTLFMMVTTFLMARNAVPETAQRL